MRDYLAEVRYKGKLFERLLNAANVMQDRGRSCYHIIMVGTFWEKWYINHGMERIAKRIASRKSV